MNKKISAAKLAYIHAFCKQASSFFDAHSLALKDIDGVSGVDIALLRARAQIAAEYAIDPLWGVQFEVQEDEHGE